MSKVSGDSIADTIGWLKTIPHAVKVHTSLVQEGHSGAQMFCVLKQFPMSVADDA